MIGRDGRRSSGSEHSAIGCIEASNKAYLSWLKNNDFQLSGCTIGISEPRCAEDIPHATGLRGVIATEDLPDGHTLFRIPAEVVLTARSSAHAPAIAKAQLPGGAALALALCLENGDAESRWREYLDSLPLTLHTPHFWTVHQRRMLKGTRVLERANLDAISRCWEKDIAPRFCNVSLHDFIRFGAIVLSYSFTVEGSQGPTIAMLPFADMLNSTPTGMNANAVVMDDMSFEMVTTAAVPKGAELMNSYGERSNAELLTRYGYVGMQNLVSAIAFSVQELLAASVRATDAMSVTRLRAVLAVARKRGDLPRLETALADPFAPSEAVLVVELVGKRLRAPLLWKAVGIPCLQRVVRTRLKQICSAELAEQTIVSKVDNLDGNVGLRVQLARSVRDECREILMLIDQECKRREKKKEKAANVRESRVQSN